MDITPNKINDGIARGIDFLRNFQLPDGEFPSYRTDKKMGPADWLPDSAVFPTALIAYSLKYLEGQKVKEIRNRAKRFLLAEMHPLAFGHTGVQKAAFRSRRILTIPVVLPQF